MSSSPHDDWLGPVDHLVVHITDPASSTAGFAALRTVVDSGAVRILDLEVLRRSGSGVEALDAGTWGDSIGVDLHALDQTFSGLLDDEDRLTAVDGFPDDGVALVVVYETTVLWPVVQAWSGAGTEVRSEGPVALTDIEGAVADHAEGAQS